jgi:hypothetical protein
MGKYKMLGGMLKHHGIRESSFLGKFESLNPLYFK